MDPGRQETSAGERLELRGKTLRWRRRTREDEPDAVKKYPERFKTEDPKVQGKPRTKGEEASHRLPRF